MITRFVYDVSVLYNVYTAIFRVSSEEATRSVCPQSTFGAQGLRPPKGVSDPLPEDLINFFNLWFDYRFRYGSGFIVRRIDFGGRINGVFSHGGGSLFDIFWVE